MASVTGIYYDTHGVNNTGFTHEYYVITYADGTNQTVDFGPSGSNGGDLVQQNYAEPGWQASDTTIGMSQVGISEYGSLDAAALALQNTASAMGANLLANPLSYDYVTQNSNSAGATLGDAVWGYEPDNGTATIGSGQPIDMSYATAGYYADDPADTGSGQQRVSSC